MTYPVDTGRFDAFGNLVSGSQNVQVDFVWGNFPLQPDQDRGGEGQSDTLNMTLDNHVIADIGWSNYPSYIPNYSGDEDIDLETVVPNVRGLKRVAAQDALDAAFLVDDITYITPSIISISTTGKTATIVLDDANSYGLAVGDVISGSYDDGDAVSGNFTDAKIKSVDGDTIVATLKTAIDPALDIASGLINSNLYANFVSGTDNRFVLVQGEVAGDIVNRGATVTLDVLQDND